MAFGLPFHWFHHERKNGLRVTKMSRIVDARGLSCPQPVMATLKEIKKPETGEIIVLVDMDTFRENVCRAAGSQGWQAKKN
jgi:tRNA 2-thiouridine synthesizing protein A